VELWRIRKALRAWVSQELAETFAAEAAGPLTADEMQAVEATALRKV
jgi:hypothetical protein